MAEADFDLVAVAFVHSVGGRIRVLFAIDRDGQPLHSGDPAVLVEHRPGRPAHELVIEVADAIPAAGAQLVATVADAITTMIELAHDRDGGFHGQRLVGQVARLRGPRTALGEH